MLRFLTAGESHGPCLTGIVDGLPAGLALAEQAINDDLRRRQGGYGRGGRQSIEHDQVEIVGGLDRGRTTGAPLALRIANRDWENVRGKEQPPMTVPRPGHADLAGALKYGFTDMRPVAERASARAEKRVVPLFTAAGGFANYAQGGAATIRADVNVDGHIRVAREAVVVMTPQYARRPLAMLAWREPTREQDARSAAAPEKPGVQPR